HRGSVAGFCAQLVQQSSDRRLDRGKRRANVVSYCVKECGLEPLAAPQRFSLAGALECIAKLVVQSLDLAAPRFSFLSASLRTGGELSGSDCGDQECDESDPVVGIGDGQGVKRPEKEKVKTEHAKQGADDGRARPPLRGYKQDHQQHRQRNRCRVYAVAHQPEGNGHRGNSRRGEDVSCLSRLELYRHYFLRIGPTTWTKVNGGSSSTAGKIAIFS